MFSTLEAGDIQDIVDSDDGEGSGEDFEIIAEGLASTVSKTLALVDNYSEPQFVAVKTCTTIKRWAKEPHDIMKECRILKRLSHPNIISVLDTLLDRSQNTMNIWMPFIPHSLTDLLNSVTFVPRLRTTKTDSQAFKFLYLTRSLMTQILHAVVYLHTHRIAHRDIKPANVLLARSGRVKLIDFGIAWDEVEEDMADRKGDMWPEEKNKMYFEVSTGPYRAPELLFGTRSYDPYAIDRWSLGALFAEFFTKLAPASPSSEDYPSFISSSFPSSNSSDPLTRCFRESLFDASRGEIGLAWSIFRILGTPREPKDEEENEKTWAWVGFEALPDAQKVEFKKVDGVGLDEEVFPNLPSEGNCSASAVDLLRGLLRYPPESRLKAQNALEHIFLSPVSEHGRVLMPEDLDQGAEGGGKLTKVDLDGTQKTLGDLLIEMLGLGY
ncbi:hypothetical protein GYMLUDRAFT_35988 [Collybiopsis luxurians FD-317 M1]|nr:hypothetical protein GYMLUDRAFT_35988 [Collybiopsis luxurians FD-317 M1]